MQIREVIGTNGNGCATMACLRRLFVNAPQRANLKTRYFG